MLDNIDQFDAKMRLYAAVTKQQGRSLEWMLDQLTIPESGEFIAHLSATAAWADVSAYYEGHYNALVRGCRRGALTPTLISSARENLRRHNYENLIYVSKQGDPNDWGH